MYLNICNRVLIARNFTYPQSKECKKMSISKAENLPNNAGNLW